MASFGDQLDAFANKTDARANAVVRKIVLDVGASLVMRSPVDTGRFRGNWQYGLDVAPRGNLTLTDKGGAETIDRLSMALPADPSGKVNYVVNNLPYGPRLENGWSQQAPQGMVGLTVLEFQPIVSAAVRALK